MKKIYILLLCSLMFACVNSQNPYGTLYTILNTECQNANCHSSTSSEALKFDGDSNAVYNAIFNQPSSYAASVANHEMLVRPEMPYNSFLLKKIAGAGFDTDLSFDTASEGQLMLDINGDQLSNTQIEYFRQWIRFGAMESYVIPGGQPYPQYFPAPDFATIAQYYSGLYGTSDTPVITPFLPKPPPPAPGTGIQLRCGPVFLPVTGAVEQEILQQQEVDFPYLPEITEIDGYMNEQSHHFLLFAYQDTASAHASTGSNIPPDLFDIGQVTPTDFNSFAEPFSPTTKNLTGAWQTDNNLVFPKGTAVLWDQTTILDMDYHTRNYNATSVLPCDFYFNIYYQPREANIIPMLSHLVNNERLGETFPYVPITCFSAIDLPYTLPDSASFTQNYEDQDNTSYEQVKYIWMTAGHTHQYGTGFNTFLRDTTGELSMMVYNGDSDYANGVNLGEWDWHHPPLEYFNPQLPVVFGGGPQHNSGLTASTSWFSEAQCVGFGFTTLDEMQLFYYMYTTVLPPSEATAVTSVSPPPMYFQVMPNPMSTSGKLVYSLNNNSLVQADIVDITGKVIASLSPENEVSGVHEVNIANGQKIAAGIYFAKLIIDGNLYTKKFVVTE